MICRGPGRAGLAVSSLNPTSRSLCLLGTKGPRGPKDRSTMRCDCYSPLTEGKWGNKSQCDSSRKVESILLKPNEIVQRHGVCLFMQITIRNRLVSLAPGNIAG